MKLIDISITTAHRWHLAAQFHWKNGNPDELRDI
jgi:hypothetical protein